jgi:tRNA dimethylallyltransferase
MAPPARRARADASAPPLAVIVGATASGKTDLALALARRLPVEVVVADSRQVYRGMDIGTAKPDAAIRAAVPHHLLDLVDPDKPFTVADWLSAARGVLPEIGGRGHLPLIVGGTGLFVSALVDGYLLPGGSPSAELHERLTAELETEGLAILARRLADRDPETAARIDLRNPRRVLRALERLETNGGVETAVQREAYPAPVALLGISRPRPVLAERIGARSAAMFASGLLDEVRTLRSRGYGAELGPMSAHGYREALHVLSDGWSVDRAVGETARRTRQYAKRQLTWFRGDRRIVWLSAGALPAEALAQPAIDLVGRLLG